MRRFFNILSGWFRRPRRTSLQTFPLAAAPSGAELTAAEVEDWKLILDSPLGTKVLDKARAMHYALMVSVTDSGGQYTVKRAHTAQGFAEAINWLINLGAIRVPVEVKKETATNDEAEAEEVYIRRVSP